MANSELSRSGYRATIVGGLPLPHVEAEHADVLISLDDGRNFNGVFATLANLDYLRKKAATEGECANGSYLWIKGLVVIRDFDKETIAATLDDLVSSGEIQHAFVRSVDRH